MDVQLVVVLQFNIHPQTVEEKNSEA
jgi:hypothetical protein